MNLLFIIGTLGAFLILVAFFLNQIHKWKSDNLAYDLLNLIGAVFLLAYAVKLSYLAIPFIIVNTAWAAISLRDVFIDIKNKGGLKN